MLSGARSLLKKNRFIFAFFRLLYLPLKPLLLYRPKKECRDEAIATLRHRSVDRPAVFYFGVPIHKNLGDLAQTYCALKYFEKYWPEYEVLPMKTYAAYSRRFRRTLSDSIQSKDVIVFQSGYCTTDKHLDHTMHKILLKCFPDAKFVFLPQTVLFKNKNELAATARIFNSHRKMLFLARDRVSLDYAARSFPQVKHMACFPDIVTTLIGSREPKSGRAGILLCMRNDYEQLYTAKDIKRMQLQLLEFAGRVDVTDTTCEELGYGELMANLEEEIFRKIDLFSNYEAIITDRYHGTIFALIANVPVVVLSSTDHKVKTGLDWFDGLYDGMYFSASCIADAAVLAKRIIEEEPVVKNRAHFEGQYYSELRSMIESV